MPNSTILEPVSAEDPCGPDLRWDDEFLALMAAFAAAGAQGAASVVEGGEVESPGHGFDDVVDKAVALSARSKDVRVLGIYAEASWHQGGLVAFAVAMEELAAVQERWPGGDDGVHPREDEPGGDRGERAAAVGRLLNRVPALAATIGWGSRLDGDDRRTCADVLRGVFGSWNERMQSALGDQLPSASDAWRAIERLIDSDVSTPESNDGVPGRVARPACGDAWDLVDQALCRMAEQDRHSPALPLLRLLSTWRSLGIIEIVEGMRGSGVTLEQLMESIKRQIQPP